MIQEFQKAYALHTASTSYVFAILPSGHLEHLYYGEKLVLQEEDLEGMKEKRAFLPGNTNAYSPEFPNLTLEDIRLEMSSYGKGDIREPFVEVIHEDGSMTSDFLFEKAEVLKGKPDLSSLPSSYEDEEGNVETLKITLLDQAYDLRMELYYSVFEKQNVIVRSAKLINDSKGRVVIQRLMSNQVDFDTADYILTTFNGSWAHEMTPYRMPMVAGKHVNASYTGCTSNRANSFVMLSKEITTEEIGPCYGFHLLYSGNHYEAVEVSSYRKTRIVTGINPQSFSYTLEPGACFEAPEAAMAYSNQGYQGMSKNMHDFVRQCIVRGEWKDKPRPILLNSWEAAYFNINEHKLLKLAKAAKEQGVELFVMDDGWFGERNDDTSSLGDWFVNTQKLPHGLEGICRKVNALGLDFGLWVEPEMVNVKSKLYEAHPDWCIAIPGKAHSEGRNQRILDFCNPEVVDYMTQAMRQVFSSANISYVKWDMNRTFTDYYSPYLPEDRQGEVGYRYMQGFYRMLGTLTKEFPHILFEGCAAGGNRFDLGVLCYFPQIWASDDTDALFRSRAQTAYSYGYPMSTLGCHVSSCPNHQTLRVTPLTSRFAVAFFGICGYECNFCDMSKEELAEVREEIALLKEWRTVLQFGDFYRGRQGNLLEWTCVSPDKKKAVGMIFQTLVEPNTQFAYYKASGLDPQKRYHFTNRPLKYDIRLFGDLVNTASPVHVKPDSALLRTMAHFVKMPGETEDEICSGAQLMNCGMHLKQAFSGTGYSDQVRFFGDFSARLYFMEAVEE